MSVRSRIEKFEALTDEESTKASNSDNKSELKKLQSNLRVHLLYYAEKRFKYPGKSLEADPQAQATGFVSITKAPQKKGLGN
jgi:hypothetical protein